jgi:hypothetical protein
MLRRIYSAFSVWHLFLAAMCLVGFVVVAVAGEGVGSLKFIGWGAVWLVLGASYATKARHGRRQEQLRTRRKQREASGLSPRRPD